ncbi:hypothetical protein GCM10022254_00310 [Actinomadura meridiana]|uniref:HTH merR-type domain-containing protein n=1 Tax=Actinomadura meridiana TaxID=559626 RepID=A0ABP8BR34_9ACTN
MEETWTISELAERAAAAVAADRAAQVSGRVRDLPNERLIRWYATIGLVDPPLGRRGRTALYGPRHLLQLVAVKRRQAAGRSIAEIQVELAAATNEALERIATLPPQAAPPVQPNIDQALTPKSADRPTPHATISPEAGGQATPDTQTTPELDNDWPTTTPASDERPVLAPGSQNSPTAPTRPSSTPPAPATSTNEPSNPEAPLAEVTAASSTSTYAGETSSQGAPTDDPTKGAASRGARPTREGFWNTRPDVSYHHQATVSGDYGKPLPLIVQGVRLAPGLTLLLDVSTISGDDLAAIEDATRPLLGELRRRGLLNPPVSPAPQPADPSRRPQ